MKLYGKAQQVANEILTAFEKGDLPKALAQVFIHRDADCPANGWSWNNRILIALRGHYDARGYRQWKEVDRQVSKGQRACYILAPRTITAKEDDEDRGIKAGDKILIGYASIPVFGMSQTEGEPLPHEEQDAAFIDELPLIEVARSWGIDVSLFNGMSSPRLGFYSYGERIGLGVENLATWAHELVHAADDRCGTLTRKSGQQLDNEVVAEFGGAVLLECLGYHVEADRGGAYAYIEAYCKKHKCNLIATCSEFLERICACVEHILAAHSGESGERESLSQQV